MEKLLSHGITGFHVIFRNKPQRRIRGKKVTARQPIGIGGAGAKVVRARYVWVAGGRRHLNSANMLRQPRLTSFYFSMDKVFLMLAWSTAVLSILSAVNLPPISFQEECPG